MAPNTKAKRHHPRLSAQNGLTGPSASFAVRPANSLFAKLGTFHELYCYHVQLSIASKGPGRQHDYADLPRVPPWPWPVNRKPSVKGISGPSILSLQIPGDLASAADLDQV